MSRNIIRTDDAPAPVGPYNQAIATTGELIFVAGQIPLDPSTDEMVSPDDIAIQTDRVLKNIEAILTAAGARFDDIVKTTIFLTDMGDFATVNQVYSQYFNSETAPARACVVVSRLPKDARVEIECIAAIDRAN